MNPDRQARPLTVDRVEWVPSSPDEIEIRVYGAWHGSTVPPPVTLVIGDDIVAPLDDPPPPGLPPAWTGAWLVPVEARSAFEEGTAALAGPGFALPLPAAQPGAMDPPSGTVVDPAVLAERRARRAELGEESAAARAASAEQTVQTLRAQLAHLEERASRASAERDRLAARVGDAERHLRATAQREEAERRRRSELEEEVASARREAETSLEDLRARLAGAEEVAAALTRELETARRRAESAAEDRAVRRAAERAAARATAEADSLRAEAESLRAEADALRTETESLRTRADEPDAAALRAEAESLRAEADALRAEAAPLRARAAEADALRARAAQADALRAEAESLRARAAQADALRAEAESLRARAALADDLQAEADSLRAESEALRAEAEGLRARARDAADHRTEVELLRARLREVDDLRAEADLLRARAEAADVLRARTAELERRLAAEPDRAEVEALHARAAELEERLAAERRAREEAEALAAEAERLRSTAPDPGETTALRARIASLEQRLAAERAARAATGSESGRERALLSQVATLEDELARRTAVQDRVQDAITLIRAELQQVRAHATRAEPARTQETAAIAELRAQLLELEERGNALATTLRAQGAELDAARRELERSRLDVADARAETLRAEQTAADARRDADELRERLRAEQAARARAEERLTQAWAPADPDPPATGDPALDTLITGLRRQVSAAREQLARWGADAPTDPPPGEARAAEREESEVPGTDDPSPSDDPIAAHPRLDEPLPPKARAGEERVDEPLPPKARAGEGRVDEPLPPKARAVEEPAGEVDAPPARPRDPAEDESRRRLQAIAAELRAAVPAEPTEREALDVVSDLQRAAERLRAAAEQELERLEGPAPVPPAPAPATTPREATPAAQPLGARPGAHTVREAAWLRTGIERLAARDPETAAQLFAALLPVQALIDKELSYAVAAPGVGSLRVVLAGGTARVEPRDRPGDPDEVDVVVEGPLAQLAPLAAGGASPWRLAGARVSGSHRKLRRLLRARRRPVRLVDLGRAGSPVHPGLLLAALAAAVDPASTSGRHFAVTYAIAGDGTFTVVAADGAPLAVVPGAPEAPDATVDVTAPAFMPLLAGHAPPQDEHATVTGDPRAAATLHAWFDAARGVATP